MFNNDTTNPKGLNNDRVAFRMTAEDKMVLLAVRDLLRPKLPFVTRTDIVRIALREAEKALREQQQSFEQPRT
ncbi:MAG: hypothetical protein JO001_22935 [Alphaproteobacteria bacterium]|nr:hypothetical protein [Alphaproteobacteria bacterium]